MLVTTWATHLIRADQRTNPSSKYALVAAIGFFEVRDLSEWLKLVASARGDAGEVVALGCSHVCWLLWMGEIVEVGLSWQDASSMEE